MAQLKYSGKFDLGKREVEKISKKLGERLGSGRSRDFWRRAIKEGMVKQIGSGKRSYDSIKNELKNSGATEYLMKSIERIRQESNKVEVKKHIISKSLDQSGVPNKFGNNAKNSIFNAVNKNFNAERTENIGAIERNQFGGNLQKPKFANDLKPPVTTASAPAKPIFKPSLN